MMNKLLTLALLGALALSLPACSKASRQERAYAKYVRKSSIVRQKQQSHFRQKNEPRIPPAPEPSEPVESTKIEQGATSPEG